MSLLTDIFEESYDGPSRFRGRIKPRKIITGRKFTPLADPEKTMERLMKRPSAFLVARDGSLMVRPNVMEDLSQPNSFGGNVYNSPFSEYGENIDYSKDVIADAYDNSFNNPEAYCDQEPEPKADNLFGLFESAATRAKKLTKRAEKKAAKGKTKAATRLANKASKFNDKIEAANTAVALNQEKEALRLASGANNAATREALNQIHEAGGVGGTMSDLTRQLQESMSTQAGQLSPLQSAAYATTDGQITPYDPMANTGLGAALAGGGGGGGAEPAENDGAVKELGGVTVTSGLTGNKTLWIVGGVVAAIILVFVIMKFAKKK